MSNFNPPISISLGQVLMESGLLTAEPLRDALLAQIVGFSAEDAWGNLD